MKGVFETDGTISGCLIKKQPTIYIGISNKNKNNLLMFPPLFKGNIYFSKSHYGHYN